MTFISIVTPCYNEEENVRELWAQIRDVMAALPQYTYEHIYVDNASKDKTVAILREIAAEDRRVKVIVNTRNFGHIRSPYHGLLQGSGAATIIMASDLEDPPKMIPRFLERWEQGAPIVAAVKTSTKDSLVLGLARRTFYALLSGLADVDIIQNFTGFGLYDRKVIDALRSIDDPYPYFRGLISELGFEAAIVPFDKPARPRGISKNNFFTLYDMAMLGITKHSIGPLRAATFVSFLMSGGSFLIAMAYLVMKLVWWQDFELGLAPLLIGVYFFSSVQLFFIGMVGEYVGAILVQVRNLPLVVEKERINF